MSSSDQFPYAVAFGLKVENSDSMLFFCGGSIITQTPRYSWAISAAHCFPDLWASMNICKQPVAITFHSELRENRSLFARVGGGDLTGPNVEWLKVLKVVKRDYNIYSMQNDVALVKIDVVNQQTVPLALQMPSSYAECVIYGYGSTSFQQNTITSSFIRYGSVNPISYERCEEILGRITAPYEGTGQFCALGSRGVDACNGE